MRKWIAGLIALSVFTWAAAQTAYNAPGGIPSSPTLQGLKVNSIPTFAGQSAELRPIICTSSCSASAVQVGQEARVYSTADGTAVTTTTPTATTLQLTSLPTGTYSVRMLANFYDVTTTTQGGLVNFTYSGTVGQQFGMGVVASNASTAGALLTGTCLTGTSYGVITSGSTARGALWVDQTCWFQASTAGNLVLNLAQGTSSANGVVLGLGSQVILTRLQ